LRPLRKLKLAPSNPRRLSPDRRTVARLEKGVGASGKANSFHFHHKPLTGFVLPNSIQKQRRFSGHF
jgi:hypothetical protein